MMDVHGDTEAERLAAESDVGDRDDDGDLAPALRLRGVERYLIGDRGFGFAAAHRGPCTRGPSEAGHRCTADGVHGHTYGITVELTDSVLRPPGFVSDYADLAPLTEYLHTTLDHRDLGDVLGRATAAVGRTATVSTATVSTATADVRQHLVEWFRVAMPARLVSQLHAVRVEIGANWTSPEPSGSTRIRFEAAHQITGLPAGHKCGRLHGHSYAVDLSFAEAAADSAADSAVHVGTDRATACAAGDRTDGSGAAASRAAGQREVHRAVADYVACTWDHRDLTTVLDEPPTSEVLARHLHAWALEHTPSAARVLRAVRVWESPRRWAQFTGDPR